MKIKVDRTHEPEGDLVFTINVSDPHHACFGDVENRIMGVLNACEEEVVDIECEESKVKDEVLSLVQAAKQKAFTRVLSNLKFSIENEFEPKFDQICQEMFNWIYDNQTPELKSWMLDFDPQRTKYYFDNDIHPTKYIHEQESEHDEEDEEDEEDDDAW